MKPIYEIGQTVFLHIYKGSVKCKIYDYAVTSNGYLYRLLNVKTNQILGYFEEGLIFLNEDEANKGEITNKTLVLNKGELLTLKKALFSLQDIDDIDELNAKSILTKINDSSIL